MPPDVVVSLSDTIEHDEVLALYVANRWSSAEKPELLMRALHGSHALATARVDGRLVGLVNAISDGKRSPSGVVATQRGLRYPSATALSRSAASTAWA